MKTHARLCPECGHVHMYSVHKLKKRWSHHFRKGFNKFRGTKFHYCSAGHDPEFTIPPCKCRNDYHKLYDY